MGNNSVKGLYDEIDAVRNDGSFYIIKKDNLFGLANKQEDIFVKLSYDSIRAYYNSGSGFIVKQKGKYGILNARKGLLQIPMVYVEIIEYMETGNNQLCFSVRQGNKYGMIKKKNEVILPIVYSAIDLSFSVSTTYYEFSAENKIAPSEHMLFYIESNLFNQSEMYVDIASVKQKYLNELLEFKYN